MQTKLYRWFLFSPLDIHWKRAYLFIVMVKVMFALLYFLILIFFSLKHSGKQLNLAQSAGIARYRLMHRYWANVIWIHTWNFGPSLCNERFCLRWKKVDNKRVRFQSSSVWANFFLVLIYGYGAHWHHMRMSENPTKPFDVSLILSWFRQNNCKDFDSPSGRYIMVDATPILYRVCLSSPFQRMLKRIDECQYQQKYCRCKHDAEDPLKRKMKMVKKMSCERNCGNSLSFVHFVWFRRRIAMSMLMDKSSCWFM